MRSGSLTMSRTVIRGFSDAYGSWKTIWRSRRTGRICRRLSLVMSLPVEDDPSRRSARCSLMIVRPSVVLPHPDSPTMPSVSPFLTARSTPETACTWPTVCLKTPALIGKCLTSPSTRRSSFRRRSWTCSADARRPCVASASRSRRRPRRARRRRARRRAPRRSGMRDTCLPSSPIGRSGGMSVLQSARPCEWTHRG